MIAFRNICVSIISMLFLVSCQIGIDEKSPYDTSVDRKNQKTPGPQNTKKSIEIAADKELNAGQSSVVSESGISNITQQSQTSENRYLFSSFNEAIEFDSSFIYFPPAPPVKIVDKDINLDKGPKLSKALIVRSNENIEYCRKIDGRLRSVTFRNCMLMELQDSHFKSSNGKPIYYVHFKHNEKQRPLGKVLVLGGVHGDELTSVSTVYLWIKTLKQFHSGLFDWRIVPVVNPDGFFNARPQRTNGNGIDLNRNLPTHQWDQLSNHYWKKYAKGTERKFPGLQAASEPETRWLVNEINNYQPDVIISVHAPYNLVDFDAVDRSNAPRRLGILRGKSLGTFPGSLGRYAGEERNIPVITLELPHSGRMPLRSAINGIWVDLISWLRDNVNSANLAGRTFSHCGDSLSIEGCI